jgi:hypothetical protein
MVRTRGAGCSRSVMFFCPARPQGRDVRHANGAVSGLSWSLWLRRQLPERVRRSAAGRRVACSAQRAARQRTRRPTGWTMTEASSSGNRAACRGRGDQLCCWSVSSCTHGVGHQQQGERAQLTPARAALVSYRQAPRAAWSTSPVTARQQMLVGARVVGSYRPADGSKVERSTPGVEWAVDSRKHEVATERDVPADLRGVRIVCDCVEASRRHPGRCQAPSRCQTVALCCPDDS